MTVIEERIKESSANFLNHVWPRIKSHLGGGELIPVEQVTDDAFAKKCLDLLAGVDAWHVQKNENRIRGIACRCQHPMKVKRDGTVPEGFRTITVRKDRRSGHKTEFDKLQAAVNDKSGAWLRPALFVQAYFADESYRDDPSLRGFAIARVEDVIGFIETQQCETNRTSSRYGNYDSTGFYVVPIQKLRDSGKQAIWKDVE